MNRTILILSLFLLSLTVTLQAQWVPVNSLKPTSAKAVLVSNNPGSIVLRFEVDGFYKQAVATTQGQAYVIRLDEASQLLEAGAPDLPKLTASLNIHATDEMAVRVLSQQYTDYPQLPVAPSKGNLYRDTDPSTVPYSYGKAYTTPGLYPGYPAALREPYILRDLRGQALVVYPFQYDALNQTLRVIHEMTVEVYSTGNQGFNPLPQLGNQSLDREYHALYASHFLNYSPSKYTPLDEHGKMLVISHGSFMNEMLPFVQWKNESGIPTEMVDVATIGATSTAIKNFISNYYTTNGLTFVLLVGDAAQIPTVLLSSGHSDNAYGYLTGNDSYPEVMVGRFSAENTMDVQTQVKRTLDYERDAMTVQAFYSNSIGIASNQGPGDDNEYDYQHIRNMQLDLLGFTYQGNLEYFDGSQGGNDMAGNPSASQVATGINGGAGIILYTGHGSSSSWGTSGFSNSNIASLTNTGMLPFIWSVACVNGNFVGNTCFAEAWMRGRSGDQPTGAVATLMSTINQSWDPPMEGQDEMVDILVESYASNIKRTFGGLSMNGCMKMNDTYGSAGYEMTDTWNMFGDPSLMVRTDTPMVLTATYQAPLLLGSSQLTVSSPANGALVTLSHNGQALASELISGGMAILNFPALSSLDSLKLVITQFNHIPYIANVTVIPASGPYVIYCNSAVNDSAGNQNGMADPGESLLLDVSLQNLGVATAGQVTATLSTTDIMVSLQSAGNTWGNIAAGDTNMLNAAFSLQVSSMVPDQHTVLFDLDIADTSGNQWSSVVPLTLNAPSLTLGEITIDDQTGGNGNGVADPGELIRLTVPVSNVGHSAALAAQMVLVSMDPLATVDTMNKVIGLMSSGAQQDMIYHLQLDSMIAPGTNIALNCHAQAGPYDAQRTYYLTVGEVVEDFESGDFTRFSWSFSGSADWTITSANPYEGTFSARSGVIPNQSSSVLEISMNVLADDTISFYRKVSSENNYDYLTFYIDGNQVDSWSGEQNWARRAYPVSAGQHTFSWEYAKDFYMVSGQDCAWLDYISLPPVSLGSPSMTAIALADPASICEGGSTQLNAWVNGGSGNYTYAWSPGTGLSDTLSSGPTASPAVTTVYTVVISDGASSVSADVTVTVHPVPVTPLIHQQGSDLVSSATDGNQWYDAAGPIAGATAQTYTPTASGTYHVIVTSTHGCVSLPSNTLTVVGAGMDEMVLSRFQVWPNPAQDYFVLAFSLDEPTMLRISLIDLLGQEVRLLEEGLRAQGQHSLRYTTSGLVPGIYLLRTESPLQVHLERLLVR